MEGLTKLSEEIAFQGEGQEKVMRGSPVTNSSYCLKEQVISTVGGTKSRYFLKNDPFS